MSLEIDYHCIYHGNRSDKTTAEKEKYIMADKNFDKRVLLEALSLDNLESVSGGVLSDSYKSRLAKDCANLKSQGVTKQEFIDYLTEAEGSFPAGSSREDFMAYVDEVWDKA